MRGDCMPAGPDGPLGGQWDPPPAMLLGACQVLVALEAKAITEGQAERLLAVPRDQIVAFRDGVVRLVRLEARRLDGRRPAA
jgi:hypothetical protein